MTGDVNAWFECQIHAVNIGAAHFDGPVNHAWGVARELDGNDFVRTGCHLVDVKSAVFGFDGRGPLRHGSIEPAVSLSQHYGASESPESPESRAPRAEPRNVAPDVKDAGRLKGKVHGANFRARFNVDGGCLQRVGRSRIISCRQPFALLAAAHRS